MVVFFRNKVKVFGDTPVRVKVASPDTVVAPCSGLAPGPEQITAVAGKGATANSDKAAMIGLRRIAGGRLDVSFRFIECIPRKKVEVWKK